MASMTVAASVAGIGAAQATGGSEKCSDLQVKYSIDGGQSWSQGTRLTGDTAPTKFIVKLVGKAPKGCEFNVSLAYYSADGPTWETSGTQALIGWETATLSKSKPEVTLDVSDVPPSCFGQVDLYGNGTKYDGAEGNGALPHYPDVSTPDNLIAPWNGGAPCTGTPSPTPSDTASPTPSPSVSDTTSPSPSPSDSGSPSPSPSSSDTTSPSPSPSDSGTPTATPSSTAPAGGSSTPPTGTPVVQPVSSTPTGNLAETGGNGTQTVAFAGGGAALLVAGGAAVYFTRRRNRTGA